MDLSTYYAEICKQPILKKEEEQRLMAIYKDEAKPEKDRMKARETLLTSNLRFVFKQAKKCSRNDPSSFGDLISAGNEGLIVGLEKFNPANGTRLLSYAGWWVQQRMWKELSKMRIVALPIWKQQLSARIAKAKDNMENVTLDDIKKEFSEIPEKDIKELYDTRYLTYYIEDMEESNFLIDPIGEEVERNLDNEKIYNVVKTLPELQRDIMVLTFGLDDGKEHTVQQICRRLLITKDNFREQKRLALEELKIKLANTQI